MMATAEQPITRTDLREELDRALRHYETKADLSELEARLTWRIVWAQLLGMAAMSAVVTAAVAIMRFLA